MRLVVPVAQLLLGLLAELVHHLGLVLVVGVHVGWVGGGTVSEGKGGIRFPARRAEFLGKKCPRPRNEAGPRVRN